jgi:hypothetical protein
MAKDSGSGDSIYGHIPDAGVDKVVKEALADLDDSSSNTVNGPLKSKTSHYPEEGE